MEQRIRIRLCTVGKSDAIRFHHHALRDANIWVDCDPTGIGIIEDDGDFTKITLYFKNYKNIEKRASQALSKAGVETED